MKTNLIRGLPLLYETTLDRYFLDWISFQPGFKVVKIYETSTS